MICRIDELVVDEDSYPRANTDWQVVLKYAQAMELGAKFPDIEIAIINGKKYVIDGVHRVGSNKRNGAEFVSCTVNKNVKNLNDLYLVAVQRNVGHGKSFSQHERRQIILKLQDMKVAKATISALVGIPISKMELYLGKKFSHTISGQEIILKKPIEHLSKGGMVDDEVEQIQSSYTGTSITLKLDNLISMLEHDLIDLNNESVADRLRTLRRLLNKMLRKPKRPPQNKKLMKALDKISVKV